MRRVIWLFAFGVGAVVFAGYPWMPDLTRSGVDILVCWAAAVGIAVGAFRNRVRPLWPWMLFVAGQACLALGDTLWDVVELRYGEVPSPSLIDLVYLAYYPLAAAGLLALARRRDLFRQWSTVVDVLIVVTAAGLLIWMLIRPSVVGPGLTPAARVVNLSYPLGDLALLVMALRLALGPGKRSTSYWLILSSILLMTCADLAFLVASARSDYESGGAMDLLWLFSYLAFAAACLHPSMRLLGEPGHVAPWRLGWGRITLLASSLFAMPIVLSLTGGSGGHADMAVFVAGATVVCVLLLVRVVLVVRQLERAVSRERSIRSEGAALVTASADDEVVEIIGKSAQRLVGPKYRVGVVNERAGAEPGAPNTDVEFAGLGVMRIPINKDGWEIEVDGDRPLDPFLVPSLRTLAGGAALAFDAVARDQSRLRGEERFRAIVRASSDIIFLIQPDSAISWCGESVERICGYQPEDLVGRKLDSLLHPDDRQVFAYLAESMTGASAPAVRVDARLRLSDGSYRVFQVTAQNLLDEPAVAGLVVTGLDVTERRALADQLTARALYDDLTRLPNRALLLDRIGQAFARRRRDGRAATLLLIGLDGFKGVNDSLGHEAGDELLTQVTHRVLDSLRSVDTAARLGGDEFAVLVEDAKAHQVTSTVRRLLDALQAPFPIGDREVFISASIGIASTDDQHDDAEDMLRDANIAMRRAKAAGKNRAKAFQPSMYADAVRRLELSGDLQRALQREELVVHYQPIVRLSDGRTRSFEALVRWAHPTHGMVRPTQFIPLAEETGLVIPLGRWMLERACHQARHWQERFDKSLTMAVNLSARHLVDESALADIDTALGESGLDPSRLTVEITESALIADLDLAARKLQILRDRGVRIAIDDFGTGYSSLSYLDRLPIDVIKIDRSFVAALEDATREPTLVRVMLDLAKRLDIPIIAEGIETPTQMERLIEMGCPLGQGYLFAQPQEALSLERVLAERMALAR